MQSPEEIEEANIEDEFTPVRKLDMDADEDTFFDELGQEIDECENSVPDTYMSGFNLKKPTKSQIL